MTNTQYVEVWNSEAAYIAEVFTRDQIIEQLLPKMASNVQVDHYKSLCTESLVIELACKRIGKNFDGRLIPASHMIRSYLDR